MSNLKSSLNFGAGPAKLPREVLLDVQNELICYNGVNMSIMEMSHRSEEFAQINNEAQKLAKELLNVPDNYKILFLHGGGNGMFAAVALNLLGITGTADYLVTGTWSTKAAKEATKYGKVNLIFPKFEKFIDIPEPETWKDKLDPNASYLYYCDNETVDGVQFPYIPESKNGVPIVSDMSSSIMTKQIDISKFGVIIAGAQKNIGPAGATIVIVRDDLLNKSMNICPSIWDFSLQAKNNSLYNTPAVFPIYVMNKVFKWIEKNGGVKEMERISREKSDLLYRTIDESNGFYSCPIQKKYRSRMNVPFRIDDDLLDKQFMKEAESLDMYQLKGHRSVGGMRASLYNAVTLDDVAVLTNFMKEFQKRHQGLNGVH